jgi:hypothetical protein
MDVVRRFHGVLFDGAGVKGDKVKYKANIDLRGVAAAGELVDETKAAAAGVSMQALIRGRLVTAVHPKKPAAKSGTKTAPKKPTRRKDAD